MTPSTIVLLGPQRLSPTLNRAVESLGLEGPIAAVTAGWEEREGEDGELREHLGGRTINLALHARREDVLRRDPELATALRERYRWARKLQDLYRLRLVHAMDAARELLRRNSIDGFGKYLEGEQEAALEEVRTLDADHLARARALREEFDGKLEPRTRDAVAKHRRELESILAGTSCLCIAGGHVSVLLNVMRLFGVLELAGDRPVIGWSAGAMVLSERIVLFHDSPPQGVGHAEVLDRGLEACRDLVALPHASKRLALDDRARVSLFARRFGPAVCVVLDPKTRVDRRGGRWIGDGVTRRMTVSGALEEIEAA
jgi:hypothetical protein